MAVLIVIHKKGDQMQMGKGKWEEEGAKETGGGGAEGQ